MEDDEINDKKNKGKKGNKNNRDDRKKGGKEDLKSISKTMTYILRHEADKFNLEIEKDGFVSIDDFLNCAPLKKHNVTKELLKKIVQTDEKGRYEMTEDKIRCVQGHSNKDVEIEEASDPITDPFEHHLIVHGTYVDSWESIKLKGLNKMKRNAIHFATGFPKDDGVKSGMRTDCEVYVEVNLAQCFYNKLKFFISKNGVVLSPGDEGVIPSKFFKIVHSKNGEVLYKQK